FFEIPYSAWLTGQVPRFEHHLVFATIDSWHRGLAHHFAGSCSLGILAIPLMNARRVKTAHIASRKWKGVLQTEDCGREMNSGEGFNGMPRSLGGPFRSRRQSSPTWSCTRAGRSKSCAPT